MDQTYSKLVIHVVTWICLSILLPLLPIGLGVLIATLQVIEVSIWNLLNGIELLLISLGLITATGIDFFGTSFDRSARLLTFFFIQLLLIFLGIGSIILLTLIYVDAHVIDMKFDTDTKFFFVGILAVSVTLVTVVLQTIIGYTRYSRNAEDANS